MKIKNYLQGCFLLTTAFVLALFTGSLKAQTITNVAANGLLYRSSISAYDLVWYSDLTNPFMKSVTLTLSGISSSDKITVTGSSSADQTEWNTKTDVTGYTAWKDVKTSSTATGAMCVPLTSGQSSIVIDLKRLGTNSGAGTFINNIYIDIADASCNIVSGTNKRITLRCTSYVAANTYNYNSTATYSNYSDASSWTPTRSSTSSSDILAFDNGTTPIIMTYDVASSQTINKLVIMPYSDVTLRNHNVSVSTANPKTLNIDAAGLFYLHDSASLKYTGTDTMIVNLGTGAIADINGNLTIKSQTGEVPRLTLGGSGNVYFGGDVDIQSGTSLQIRPNASNTVFFDGTSQTLKGSGELMLNQLTNVTVGTGSTSNLNLERTLPIYGIVTVLASGKITSNTPGSSPTAQQWQDWSPNLQLKNNGLYKGMITTMGNSSSSIVGGVLYEMWNSGNRAWRTVGFPLKNSMNLSQITDDIVISGNKSGSDQDSFYSFNSSCSYCVASSFKWDEATHSWVEFESGNTANKVEQGKGMMLFFRGLGTNGLGNPAASANAGAMDFKGEIKYGASSVNLSYTNTGNSLDGYNLVSNPYPCNIDFTQVTRSSSVANKFMLYQPNQKTYNIWDKSTGTLQRTGTTAFTGGNATASGFIEMGASFFVMASASGQSLTFAESNKVTSNPPTSVFKSTPEILTCNQLKLKLEFADHATELMDQNLIEWDVNYKEASKGYDMYDMGKLYGGGIAIGTKIIGDNWLGIDRRPESMDYVQRIPLKLLTLQDTLYEISYNTCPVPQGYSVKLIDKETNKFDQILDGETYKFMTNKNDKYSPEDRFELYIMKTAIAEQSSGVKDNMIDKVYVYPNPVVNQTIRIATVDNVAINEVQVYSIDGKLIKKYSNQLLNNDKIELPVVNGNSVIVKVVTNLGVHNQIIFLN